MWLEKNKGEKGRKVMHLIISNLVIIKEKNTPTDCKETIEKNEV